MRGKVAVCVCSTHLPCAEAAAAGCELSAVLSPAGPRGGGSGAAAPGFSFPLDTTMTKFGNLSTDSGVQALDDYLGDRSYVEG